MVMRRFVVRISVIALLFGIAVSEHSQRAFGYFFENEDCLLGAWSITTPASLDEPNYTADLATAGLAMGQSMGFSVQVVRQSDDVTVEGNSGTSTNVCDASWNATIICPTDGFPLELCKVQITADGDEDASDYNIVHFKNP